MPYPDSPFNENFNYKTINNLLDDEEEKTISKEVLTNLLKWLCSTPKITSLRINNLKTKTEEVLSEVQRYFNLYFQENPNVYVHPTLTNTIIIESQDVINKLFKRYEKEIVIDCDCGSAVLRGAHVYAPGVLGMVTGCQLNNIVSVYADPEKKCKKGLQKMYENDSKIYIGNGRVKMQRYQLFSVGNTFPSGIAVEMFENISGCPTISERIIPTGHALLQNLPSIICVNTLDPKQGNIVLDMCASPGNKTTHIADLMENEGILVAIDKTPRKVRQLQSRCNDFDVKANIFKADSTIILGDHSLSMRSLEDGPPFPPESFDKILLDAPCSVLGKRPQLVNKMSDNQIKSYVPLQRKLFKTAVKLLKPGGTMVYSTCTITLAENEGIVAWALKQFSCMELLRPSLRMGEDGWVGTSLTDEELSCVQRFGPNSEVDSIGFFFAYLKKKTSVTR